MLSTLFSRFRTSQSSSNVEQVAPNAFVMGQSLPSRTRASFLTLLKKTILQTTEPVHVLNSGEDKKIYFPQELIGGVCPWVPGQEDDIVWRAAAAACGAERIHAVWQVYKDKIFYLAIKSEEMSSHYNSWCPFSALLPGMTDAVPAPVCYTYYSNGSAAMMIITPDNLQIYRGITLIARAKAERASRELNNAPIIELTPDRISHLMPSPWYSVSLFEDRSRRILAAVSVISALAFAGLAFLIWLYASYSFISSRVTIASHQDHLEGNVSKFSQTIDIMRSNPLHQQLADFVRVNDGLLSLDGLMLTYEIKNGEPYWRASVNSSLSPDILKSLDAVNIESAPNGKIIIGHGLDDKTHSLTSGGGR